MIAANWLEVIQTCNLSPTRRMDPVSRWLLITRACVLHITVIAWLTGAFLARADGPVAWIPAVAALLGLLLAHAANNMINDHFDLASGIDSAEYPRALYAPHPVLGGLISSSGLLRAIFVANGLDLAILIYLASLRGWGVVAFALAGLFLSVFYVAPPLRLKRRGLGEASVFLVWGPLMIGGTYLVAAGTLTLRPLLCSLPYACLVMTALVGKHLDKLDEDVSRGIRTLPAILGAPAAMRLNRLLMIAFYVIVLGLIGAKMLGPWLLLVFLSLPRLRGALKAYAEPKPTEPPPNFPVWPLWYVAWAFFLARRTGALFVLGLALDAFFPLEIPLW
jgi:1,4-dihydroxy-2-naphthoate octaprenyltransferase